MIRKCQIIFCDNEHGWIVSFPDLNNLGAHDVERMFVQETSTAQIRKLAKEAGWGRVNGGDYCPGCMESM